MSPRSWPEPVAVDPDRAELPAPVRAVLERQPAPPVLLLLTGEDAHRTGWGAAVALRIAAVLSRGGRRVVLADLGFDDPTLHAYAGLPNEEGLSDVFLFGASLRRVARPVPQTRFYLASAGAFAGEPQELLEHEAWPRLIDGFHDAEATLVAYLPLDTPGAQARLDAAGEAVALGTAGDLPVVRKRAGEVDFLATVVPPGPPVPPRETAIEEPVFIERTTEPRRPRALNPLYLVLLLITLAVAAWALFGDRITSRGTSTANAAPPPPVAEPAPVETPLPYSVAIESHQTLETASQRVDALRREEPEAEFYAAPVPVYGRVWYRVMAGPFADSASAAGVLDRLVERGLKRQAEEHDVRTTEWAYLLGEFASRGQAEQRVGAVEAGGVPAYVVTVEYTAGAPRYRVYAGAYETLQEAETMAAFLDSAGVTGHSLKRRTGTIGA